MEIRISEQETCIKLLPAEFYAILEHLDKKESQELEDSWKTIRKMLRESKESNQCL